MNEHIYRPGPPLSNFVDLFWIYEGVQQPHKKERLLPDGGVALVVNLKDDEIRLWDKHDVNLCHTFDGSILVGPHSEYFIIDTAEQYSVAGVEFRPGGAFPFFDAPVTELHNQHLGLDKLWGRQGGELRTRLLETPTVERKFAFFEQALMAMLFRPLERHRAVSYALNQIHHAPQIGTITAITNAISLSPKRFIQVFSEEVGLTPKLFCRVRRFQRVIKMLNSGARIDWADVAAACGYFDQAHFIRDFRAFSGINPSSYAAQRIEHLNHVPIVD